jgi:hypothetical protein
MEKFYWILTVFIVSTSLVMIGRNLRELLARNSRLENLSKRRLLNSVINRGLYTLWLFGLTYWLFINFPRDPEDFFVSFYLWTTLWAVEAFTSFLIPCKELIRKSKRL